MVFDNTVVPPRHSMDDVCPTRRDCKAALARVLASDPFNAAPRLSAFLQFVVEAALSTPAVPVKAYTIAVGALGRTEDFDPATDAIVRVEARRLRRALARYYAGVGTNDPIIIEMPRGRYTPIFQWHVPVDEQLRNGQLADVRLVTRAASAIETHRTQHEILTRNLATLQSQLASFRASIKLIAVPPHGRRSPDGSVRVRPLRRRNGR